MSKGSKKLIEELTPVVKNRGQGSIWKIDPVKIGVKNGVRGQFDPSKMVYGGVKNRGQKSIYIIYTFLTAPDFDRPPPAREANGECDDN